MRALHIVTKRQNEDASEPLDFGPWLRSIGSTFASFTMTDAAGIVETAVRTGDVVNVTFASGAAGTKYRVALTCTAANGMTRSPVIEVNVLGVAPVTPAPGGGATVENSLASNSTVNAPSVYATNVGLAGKSATGHGHAIADVSGLQAALNGLAAAISWFKDGVGVGGTVNQVDFVGSGVNVIFSAGRLTVAIGSTSGTTAFDGGATWDTGILWS